MARGGQHQISVEQVRNAYNQRAAAPRAPVPDRHHRRTGPAVRPRPAGAVNNLVTEAVWTSRPSSWALRLGQLVAASIMDDPTFKGADGQFNRALFDQALRNNGLSEAASCRSSAPPWPACIWPRRSPATHCVRWPRKEAMHRYASERRAASYVSRPAAAGEIPAADARTAPELLQRAQERVPRAGIPGRTLALDAAPSPSPTPSPMRMPARLRAAEGQVRLARAPHDPADHLPVAGRGRGCGRQASRKARPSTPLPPSATSPPGPRARHLHQGRDARPGRRRRGLRPRGGRDERAGHGPLRPGAGARHQIQPEAVRPFEEVAGGVRQELAVRARPGSRSSGSTTRSRICAPAPSRWPISPRRRA